MKLDKNEILTNLKKAGDAVTQGVAGLRKTAKLTFDISSKETELADLYRELGKSVYEESRGEHERLTPEALKAMIEACEQELEALKRKKTAQAASPICPACGREVSKKAVFCQICGAKIHPDTAEAGDCGCNASGEASQESDVACGSEDETCCCGAEDCGCEKAEGCQSQEN